MALVALRRGALGSEVYGTNPSSMRRRRKVSFEKFAGENWHLRVFESAVAPVFHGIECDIDACLPER